jgi:hypothetical protein
MSDRAYPPAGDDEQRPVRQLRPWSRPRVILATVADNTGFKHTQFVTDVKYPTSSVLS